MIGLSVKTLRFKVNRREIEVRDVPAQTSLLAYLRSIGLTAAKEGCEEGMCGACAVLMVKDSQLGTRYAAVNSCLIPLAAAHEEEFLTAEGLNDRQELGAPQIALVHGGGSQCGYCTPGIVVSLFAEQFRRAKRPVDPGALAGHLCRCTGYRTIMNVLLALEASTPEPHAERLQEPSPTQAPFAWAAGAGNFTRPDSLGEATALLKNDPDARVMGGYTDLGVQANVSHQRFSHLVAVDHLPELRMLSEGSDHVEIGAGLTIFDIAERCTSVPPALSECIDAFGTPQIRNRATLGGNLAVVGDLALLLAALGATAMIVSAEGVHRVPVAHLLKGEVLPLMPGAIIQSCRIPKPFAAARFYKVARRSLNDRGIVTAAFALKWAPDNRIADVRIFVGGLGAPQRVAPAEAALVGMEATPLAFELAAAALRDGLATPNDPRASGAYRAAVAGNFLSQFGHWTREQAAR